MANFTDKKILVIGGASGFGLTSARILLQSGARVIVTSRDSHKLAAVVEDLKTEGAYVEGRLFDAAQPSEMEKFFQEISELDGLISMAGGFMGGGFLEAPLHVIHNAIEDKLYANLNIARAAAPFMKEGGAMVFTAGSGGRPDNASGAIIGNEAVSSMVRGLAVEMAPKVRVNAVAPTWTPTPLWRHMSSEDVAATREQFSRQIPLGRTAEMEEVAAAYVFLLSNSFITGQTLVVDGGLSLL